MELSWLLRNERKDVNDEEQSDPHNVNEVPVVRDCDRHRCLALAHPTHGIHAHDGEQEREQTADHVETVEAGGHIEGTGEGVEVEYVTLGDERGVLKNLSSNEYRTEEKGDVEPLDYPETTILTETLSSFGGSNAELAGDRAGHQDERVDRRERNVHHVVSGHELLRRHRAEREVDRE